VPFGVLNHLIGCCHLRDELNVSVSRKFVPPWPRSHPNSAI